MAILTEKQEALLNEERRLMSDLRVALEAFEVTTEDQATLAESIRQLDELFLLVVVGEFNAGKSAFINAMLGRGVLKEGVTPTTTQINILRYGEGHERTVVDENVHILTAPVELLSEISIVDTPGTNAIIREHEKITAQFVPRSDLVLFITSADRPFTESERAFLEKIRNWGKKVVLVLNKIDILEHDSDLEKAEKYIVENASALLGITPDVFPVSARAALRAKQGAPSLWAESRFEPLEAYIYETLDEASRVRLKLLNPLGVGGHLVEKYLRVITSRLSTLKADFDMLADVEAQLALYKKDMERDFSYRLADIENVLFGMEDRGQVYFDETLRIGRVFDLLKKDRIRKEIETEIVADVPEQIERKVAELIDWLVDADLRQWQAVMDHLAERRRTHKERIVGDPGVGGFQFDRERLISGLAEESRRVVETYDKTEEAREIAEGAQAAVATAAALEIGAVGLGTLVTIMATTAAADITGIVMASLIAALGLFIIPARRRLAKAELRSKINDLREKLIRALRSHFEKEIDRSLRQIHEAIAPYSRFVRAEQEKLVEAQDRFQAIQDGIIRLKIQIEELTPG
jgi:small GTP-binding protein